MNVMEALNWRYAVRQFSPERLDECKVGELLSATRLSATSYGLQPYRMIRVDDMNVRRSLIEYSYGQEKVADCSHLIVFAVQTRIGDEMVDRYVRSVAKTRGIPVDELKGLAEHMKSVFSGMTLEQRREWAHQQAYIALGTMLTVASTMEIDTCPMGGIEADGYDAVLGLSDKGLSTSVVCSLGMRHPEDENAYLKKVRYDLSEMVVVV
ncbi:nitroreductase family protein [Thiomicrorhabdus sp.]|uniref:nitroreductase family protein n=1 Tax=Thiomicrorhabdus sp. TaxID=2039724 RepID=UPI0035634B49